MNTIQRLLILPVVLFAVSTGFSQQPSKTTKAPAQNADGAAKTGNAACIPVPRTEPWAVTQHESILSNIKSPNLRVVFLGDSITHGLQFGGPEAGAAVWAEHFAPLSAAAFAVPGDKTQHVLWRITEGGELDGLHPKVVVILIGINNLIAKNTPEETAAGVTAIVQETESRLPGAKILLMGIFPCFVRGSVQETNELIAKLEDLKQVYFLDIGDQLGGPGVYRDGIHPSDAGYRIWAEAMQPYLDDLLKNDGNGELWKNRVDGKPAN